MEKFLEEIELNETQEEMSLEDVTTLHSLAFVLAGEAPVVA